MPRFTILQHHAGPSFQRQADGVNSIASGPVHWDWLFEPPTAAARLWTWATDPLPTGAPTRPNDVKFTIVRAIRLADHRVRYLDYEGEVAGDRGSVRQIATGEYELLENTARCFSVLTTISRSRLIKRLLPVVVQFTQSPEASTASLSAAESPSPPTIWPPSIWTLRTERGAWNFDASSSDATS